MIQWYHGTKAILQHETNTWSGWEGAQWETETTRRDIGRKGKEGSNGRKEQIMEGANDGRNIPVNITKAT